MSPVPEIPTASNHVVEPPLHERFLDRLLPGYVWQMQIEEDQVRPVLRVMEELRSFLMNPGASWPCAPLDMSGTTAQTLGDRRSPSGVGLHRFGP